MSTFSVYNGSGSVYYGKFDNHHDIAMKVFNACSNEVLEYCDIFVQSENFLEIGTDDNLTFEFLEEFVRKLIDLKIFKEIWVRGFFITDAESDQRVLKMLRDNYSLDLEGTETIHAESDRRCN